MQIAGVRVFEVLVIGAPGLAARVSFARAAFCGAFVGVAGTIPHLLLLADFAPAPLVLALLASGAAGLGTSVGIKLPALCRRKLVAAQLSGPLGAAWNKLTRGLLEIQNRDELFDDPRRRRLINEAFAGVFADFPTRPRHAGERMLESNTLTEELLERSSKGAANERASRPEAIQPAA